MVKLRLARGGRKKRPFYRIVAAHSPFKRDGRFIEKIGTYNPLAPIGQEIELKEERVIYWLVNGARPTDTARNIFSRKGLMLRYDMLKRGVDEKEIDAAVAEFLKNKEAAVLKKEEAKEQKRQAKPKAIKAETEEKAEVAAETAEVAETEDAAVETAAEAPAEVAEEKSGTVAEEVAEEKAEPAKEEKTEEAAKSEASEEKAEAEDEAKSE